MLIRLYFIVVMLILSALKCFAVDPSMTTVPEIISYKQDSISSGSNLIVKGTNFGNAPGEIYIKGNIENSEWSTTVIPEQSAWSDTEVTFAIPNVVSKTRAEIYVKNSGGMISKSALNIDIYQDECSGNYFKSAKEAKKSNFSETYIIDRLVKDAQNATDNSVGKELNTNLFNMCEESRLKTLGLSEEFFRKIQNDPQYVTLGVSAIWLFRTAECVPAPMLRIFLVPKTYFSPRYATFNKKTWLKSMRDRTDLNFGYTTIDSELENSQQTKYVLAGLSFELNKSALINLGLANAVNDVDHKKRQMYFGITVDYNFLKNLKLVAD